MKIFTSLISLALIILSYNAQALILNKPVTVEGEVISYDATTVTMSQNGKTFKLLRSQLEKGVVLKTHAHMKLKVTIHPTAAVASAAEKSADKSGSQPVGQSGDQSPAKPAAP